MLKEAQTRVHSSATYEKPTNCSSRAQGESVFYYTWASVIKKSNS